MSTVKNILIAGMCAGSICMTANAVYADSNTGANGKGQSSLSLSPAADMNESYAKKAKEDFQLQKKRLENERDAALTQCESKTGSARTDCRKQANAEFKDKVKQERVTYNATLRQRPSSGSSASGSHASGKPEASKVKHGPSGVARSPSAGGSGNAVK